MISIAEAISDLLFVRDTVVVPGLGAFVKKPVPAKVNPVSSYFAAPSCQVIFDPNLREDNELVVDYLTEKNGIPKEEAQKQLTMFVSDFFSTLKQGNKVVLSRIGVLEYDWANDIVLEQDQSVNYNTDSFGLCDFVLEPVSRSKSEEEIRTDIEQQQRDKNTPVTVDERAVHEEDEDDDEDDDDSRRGLGWLWIMLGVLTVAGVFFGLYYFKVGIFPWQEEQRPVSTERMTYTIPTYSKTWEWKEPAGQSVEQPETVQTEATIRIIAGCYDAEEYAAKLTRTLKEKGYAGALYEKRSNMWYVSFGSYKTDEEAAEALREIRANTEYKAWILK